MNINFFYIIKHFDFTFQKFIFKSSKAQATDSFYLTFCTFDQVICIALAVAGAVNYCE